MHVPGSWCTRSAKNGRFGERRNRSGWKTHCTAGQSTLVNHSIGLINNAVDGAQQDASRVVTSLCVYLSRADSRFLFLSAASRYRATDIPLTWNHVAGSPTRSCELSRSRNSNSMCAEDAIEIKGLRVLAVYWIVVFEKGQTWIRVLEFIWSLLLSESLKRFISFREFALVNNASLFPGDDENTRHGNRVNAPVILS